ncbi:MAG TPA: PIN domain-containing protein [Solirubrobacteraceae bacterium]|nr:PIN domain-containing protein [Solirubrobacteraceae bacterium]
MKVLDTAWRSTISAASIPAVDLLRRLIDQGESLAASELVRFELVAGVRPREIELPERFCAALVWVAVDETVTRAAGALAREHRCAFGGIEDVDHLIAATALILDADLLTTNVRHFPMLPGLQPAY